MQQPQLPPTDPIPGESAQAAAPKAPAHTHEHPERKSGKFVRGLRIYLMVAGAAATVYGLGWLLTKALVLVASWGA